MVPSPTAPDGPLLRALASSSTARRRAAMLQIETYLSSGRRFSEMDLQKLWKALFYCLYMTPKMRNQQHLAIQIAGLTLLFRGPRKGAEEQMAAQSGADTAAESNDAAEKEEEGGQESRKRKRNAGGEGEAAQEASGPRKAPKRDANHEEKKGSDDPTASDNFILFLQTFWATMIREWEGVDKVRLDKFLFLVRRMVSAGFEGCKDFVNAEEKSESEQADAEDQEDVDGQQSEQAYLWNEELLGEHVRTLAEGPLQPRNQRVPGGLRLHVLDVLVDEMDKADPARSLDTEAVLRPLQVLSETGLTKVMRTKAKEALADERLESWNDGETTPSQSTAEKSGIATTEDGGDDDFDGFDD